MGPDVNWIDVNPKSAFDARARPKRMAAGTLSAALMLRLRRG